MKDQDYKESLDIGKQEKNGISKFNTKINESINSSHHSLIHLEDEDMYEEEEKLSHGMEVEDFDMLYAHKD